MDNNKPAATIENQEIITEEKINKEPRKWLIYKHTCSVSGKFYIGQTFRTIERRWKEHLWDAHKQTRKTYESHFYKAIRKYENEKYFELGELWTHEVLEKDILTQEEANIAEIKWIAELKSNVRTIGYNISPGGEGQEISEETRAKMSKSQLGRKHSEETKEKISAWNKGKTIKPESIEKRKITVNDPEYKEKLIASGVMKRSEESIEKIRVALTGMKRSEETKKKLSIAKTGLKQSQETIDKRKATINTPEGKEKMRQAQLGHKHTEESKAKMSASRKGKPRTQESIDKMKLTKSTPEYKEKARLKATGRKHSEETKQKISKSLKDRCATLPEAMSQILDAQKLAVESIKNKFNSQKDNKNEQTQPLTTTLDTLTTK